MANTTTGQSSLPVTIPSLEQRAALAEKRKVDTLLICPDPWALGHSWTNKETGEVQRARCNRWECLHCGPRKVDLWRQLVKIAEPTLFLTLSKAGKTVEDAARALTTFVQALRRGSKGKGPNRVGARPAYLIEYFAVLERHEDFERNGFHWHILIRGVDAIPYKEVIQPLWMSATHYDEETGEGAKIGHIERIRNARAIGYVTKYLTKAVSMGERGKREVKRERVALVRDEQGRLQLGTDTITEQVTSKAHRIRYSRKFFPESVAELRMRLFAGLEGAEDGKPLEQGEESEETEKRSSWVLVDHRTSTQEEVEHYKQRRSTEVLREVEQMYGMEDTDVREQYEREALLSVLEEVKDVARTLAGEGYRRRKRNALMDALEEERSISRRVIHIWHMQRQYSQIAA